MEYNVPQFIEEESRVVGPFTLKQFFIALGLLITVFILFLILKTWVAVIFSLILVAASLFIMLGKIEGRPISSLVMSAIRFVWLPRLYIWKKPALKPTELTKEVKKEELLGTKATAMKPKTPKTLTPEDIKKLARELDIK